MLFQVNAKHIGDLTFSSLYVQHDLFEISMSVPGKIPISKNSSSCAINFRNGISIKTGYNPGPYFQYCFQPSEKQAITVIPSRGHGKKPGYRMKHQATLTDNDKINREILLDDQHQRYAQPENEWLFHMDTHDTPELAPLYILRHSTLDVILPYLNPEIEQIKCSNSNPTKQTLHRLWVQEPRRILYGNLHISFDPDTTDKEGLPAIQWASSISPDGIVVAGMPCCIAFPKEKEILLFPWPSPDSPMICSRVPFQENCPMDDNAFQSVTTEIVDTSDPDKLHYRERIQDVVDEARRHLKYVYSASNEILPQSRPALPPGNAPPVLGP